MRTDLLNIVKKEGLINDRVNFGDLRVSEAAVRTKHFTNEQPNSLQREMYIIFLGKERLPTWKLASQSQGLSEYAPERISSSCRGCYPISLK